MVEEGLEGDDAGVVDQHVQPAEQLPGAPDQPRVEVGVGHVAGEGVHLADGAEVAGDAVEAIRRDVADQQPGALLEELPGDGHADASPGAGDDRDFAFEQTHAGGVFP